MEAERGSILHLHATTDLSDTHPMVRCGPAQCSTSSSAASSTIQHGSVQCGTLTEYCVRFSSMRKAALAFTLACASRGSTCGPGSWAARMIAVSTCRGSARHQLVYISFLAQTKGDDAAAVRRPVRVMSSRVAACCGTLVLAPSQQNKHVHRAFTRNSQRIADSPA